MHGGDAGRFERFFHAEIEIGRINADKHIGADLFQLRNQLAADFQDFRQPF